LLSLPQTWILSLFVPPFPPLLGALYNQVYRGFITLSKLKALNKFLFVLDEWFAGHSVHHSRLDNTQKIKVIKPDTIA
jgi:hypothetical protein